MDTRFEILGRDKSKWIDVLSRSTMHMQSCCAHAEVSVRGGGRGYRRTQVKQVSVR